MISTILFYIKFAWHILSLKLGLEKSPYKYIIVITKKCNSRCKKCFIWTTQDYSQELTLAEYEKIAISLKNKIKWLNLTGGEVTEHEQLIDIIKVFKRHCPNLQILNFTTNAIDSEKILKLVNEIKNLQFIKIHINVSLDGTEEVHDSLRGVAGNFASALATYKILRKTKNITTNLSMTLFSENNESYEKLVNELRQKLDHFKLQELHLNIENYSNHFYLHKKNIQANQTEKTILIFEDYLKKIKFRFFSISDHLQKKYHELAISYLRYKKTPIRCKSALASLYVSETGDIYPCINWTNKLGNLRKVNYNFDDPSLQKTIQEAVSEVKNSRCPQCWTPCEAYQSLL